MFATAHAAGGAPSLTMGSWPFTARHCQRDRLGRHLFPQHSLGLISCAFLAHPGEDLFYRMLAYSETAPSFDGSDGGLLHGTFPCPVRPSIRVLDASLRRCVAAMPISLPSRRPAHFAPVTLPPMRVLPLPALVLALHWLPLPFCAVLASDRGLHAHHVSCLGGFLCAGMFPDHHLWPPHFVAWKRTVSRFKMVWTDSPVKAVDLTGRPKPWHATWLRRADPKDKIYYLPFFLEWWEQLFGYQAVLPSQRIQAWRVQRLL